MTRQASSPQRPKVFIDGEAGTTGLQIYARLRCRDDLELLRIDPELRKSPEERKRLLNESDLSILCLPDTAAREAAAWVTEPHVKLLDASSAHRTSPDWTYGFAELHAGQRAAIRSAQRVSNPGCYPTGFLALVRPLVDAGLLPATEAVSCHAVSGYSGGGRPMIEQYEKPSGPRHQIYGLGLGHKHLPEMLAYSRLESAPVFSPSVGHFHSGMLVQVPLHLSRLRAGATPEAVVDIWQQHYANESLLSVAPLGGDTRAAGGSLMPEGLAGTARMELFAFANESASQLLLVARLDNLGKGASGAAVQNMNLMLGRPETEGLDLPSRRLDSPAKQEM